MWEDLKTLAMYKRRAPTPKMVREEVLHSNPLKDPQQCKVTLLRENKNENGKRNPETQIIGNKARKLKKMKEKLENVHGVPEKTS